MPHGSGEASAGRVLVLDDDEAVGHTIRFVAEGMGMASKAVTDADSFFSAVEDWQPDHIVLDLMMPGMDGVEVMRRLAKSGCDAEIVILSGVGCEILQAARRSAHDHGLRVRGVLPKPFKPGALRELLARAPSAPAEAREAAATWRAPLMSLREAERLETLRIGYAPRQRCESGEVVDFEVVLRGQNHRESEQGSASVLIEFEALGLLPALRRVVTAKALHALVEADASGRLGVILPVALSELAQGDLAQRLGAHLEQAGVGPERVTLGLVDTGARQSEAHIQQEATRLALAGFQLLAMDVGSARMPLRWLQLLPFQELAVDAALLSTTAVAKPESWFRWLLGLRDLLECSLTLTNVSDAALAQRAAAMGCDFVQGPVVAAPLPGDVLCRWLEAR
jgi:EAL domain-containing protein (putative c-di-GMP-specific phosphodiesterase class I)